MTEQVGREFMGMVNAAVAEEAFDLLDRQVFRVREWRAERSDDASLHQLILDFFNEKDKRSAVIIVYCAALWRLMEQEDRESAR